MNGLVAEPPRAPAVLESRLEWARHACLAALNAEPLASVEHLMTATGWTAQRRAELVAAARHQRVPELFQLRAEVNCRLRLEPGLCATERVLLLRTALEHLPRIPALPVDESVKHLFCRDIVRYADSAHADSVLCSCEGPNFSSRLKVASLVRFPAGQSEWEVSGFPRAWLAKLSARDLPRTLHFLATKVKGLKPLFVGHLGVARRSPFLTERQARLGTYRSILALEKQPHILGMMGVSWLHSRETHRISPHLSFMNAPTEEMGGFYVDLGLAPDDEGFLDGDERRARLYRTGEYKPTWAAVICSREQALEWKRRNRHLEADLMPR